MLGASRYDVPTNMDAGAALNEAILEERLSALESSRAWSPRVVSRLESSIRTADDLDLFRVNPKAYAAGASIEEAEAIDLFLFAAHVGLFQMEWNLVCASCGNTARSFRTLEKLDPHFVCEICQMDNDNSLDDYIQVTFTVSPNVRAIAYHHPENLSAEDLYFRYQYSRDVRPGSGGRSSLQALQATTHYVGYVDTGDTATVELDFSGDVLAIRDLLNAASAIYLAAPQSDLTTGADDSGADADAEAAMPTEITLTLGNGRLSDRDRDLQPLEFSHPTGPPMRLLFPGAGMLSHGPLIIGVENQMPERSSVWVVEYPKIPEQFEPIEFEPILSAKQTLSTQTFRSLFRSETVATSEGLAITDLTFLFTDLRDSTAMYERIGDASAYNLVRLHFDALEVAIRDNGGAIVKTIGDAIMATFVGPADAVRAAMEMPKRLEEFNRTSSSDLALKMGLHRGHAIAVTSNDSIDYFGQTVNIAARVQALAESGQICLSEDVYQANGVRDLLDGSAVESETGIMKGVGEKIPIYRVTLNGG